MVSCLSSTLFHFFSACCLSSGVALDKICKKYRLTLKSKPRLTLGVLRTFDKSQTWDSRVIPGQIDMHMVAIFHALKEICFIMLLLVCSNDAVLTMILPTNHVVVHLLTVNVEFYRSNFRMSLAVSKETCCSCHVCDSYLLSKKSQYLLHVPSSFSL